MKIDMAWVRDIEQIADHNSRVLAAATMYAKMGFYVVPIRRDGKAIPEKKTGFNYSHASNTPKVVGKWFGKGGRFEGWNIGLACGKSDGTFVVDLDNHNGVDGMGNFKDFCPEDYVFQGPVQSTPSGGRHLIYRWKENAVSSVSKLAPGVDTRGGEAGVCKSHVVCWPSVIDGVPYKWEQGGEAPETPQFVMDSMGTAWKTKKKSGPGRGNEMVDATSIEDNFTIEQISEMLHIIDPDELVYEDWLQVGQAIHSQHPDHAGLKVWDDWSKSGGRYEGGECDLRWNGFDPSGPVRIGTLIHFAQKRGFELMHLTPGDEFRDEIEEIVLEMNKTYAVLPMGGDIMVLQEREITQEMARIESGYRIMRKSAFQTLMQNKVKVMVDIATGNPTKKTWSELWLGHELRREFPGGIGMFPGQPKAYHGYYNVWDGFSVEPAPGKWDLFKSHILNIVCDGEKDLYEWVLDWMADLYQDPANPKGCAIVMNGIEGCGKGTFAQMLGEPFGNAFKHLTDEEHLIGRFNGHMLNCVVAFADEVTYGGNKKVAGKLKSLVTERIITAEKKGVDAVQYHNCAHLLIASNERWFIPAGPQSRRWLVLEFNGKKANDEKYFNAIHKEMEKDGGAAAMLHELLERKITCNIKKAPETEALFDQRSQYSVMDSSVDWWHSQVAVGVLNIATADTATLGDDPRWPETVTKADFQDAFLGWCRENNRRTMSSNMLFKTAKTFGFEVVKLRRGGERIPGYRVPPRMVAAKLLKINHGIYLKDIEDED